MKKKTNVRAGGWSALKKICTIMKLCLILSLFAVFSVSAGSMAQNAKLSMEKKSVSLIEVLNELSEKSDYEFFYNDNEVKGVNGIGNFGSRVARNGSQVSNRGSCDCH